jgi:hypothetical protein
MDGLESRRVLEATLRLSAATFNNKVSERPSLLSFRAERPGNVDTFLVSSMGGAPVAGPCLNQSLWDLFLLLHLTRGKRSSSVTNDDAIAASTAIGILFLLG